MSLEQRTISKKTLDMMDKSMNGFAKGKVGKPINIKELKEIENEEQNSSHYSPPR